MNSRLKKLVVATSIIPMVITQTTYGVTATNSNSASIPALAKTTTSTDTDGFQTGFGGTATSTTTPAPATQASTKPTPPQGYGSGATTTGATSTVSVSNPSISSSDTLSNNQDGSSTVVGEAERCELEEDLLEHLLNEQQKIMEDGSEELIEGLFKKNEATRNCLAGFQRITDLSSFVPSIGIKGALQRKVIMEGIKKVIEYQKKRIQEQVCNMAQTAWNDTLNHLLKKTGSLKENVEKITNPNLQGIVNTQLGKSQNKLTTYTENYLSKIQKEIQQANDKAKEWADKDKEMDNYLASVNNNVSNIGENNTSQPNNTTAPRTGGNVVIGKGINFAMGSEPTSSGKSDNFPTGFADPDQVKNQDRQAQKQSLPTNNVPTTTTPLTPTPNPKSSKDFIQGKQKDKDFYFKEPRVARSEKY